MPDNFPYRKALVIGVTSGIGKALAEKMLQAGSSVIGVGRRQDRLDEFVKMGGSKASASRFDITQLSAIPDWAASIHKEHPDLDFVLINSGIQRPFDFAKPETVDLKLMELELMTNYTAYIHLAMALLPYLQQRAGSGPAGIAFTSSGLAILPMPRVPNYSATKAALHHWVLTLRQQLAATSSKVRCIELFPPLVDTELHDDKHQPGVKAAVSPYAMPLDQFTNQTWTALVRGDEQIPIGMSAKHFEAGGFEAMRQDIFNAANGRVYT
ncbi:MAG: hypothetical protein Q9159_003046 [Coniocarpon cinnabarinum]